jgi:hypothetical protein
MSWLVAYFAIATAGLLVVLAMFKVGGDADATVPLIRPDHEHSNRAEATAAVTPSLDCPRTAKDGDSAALPVVEAGSIDLSQPVEKGEQAGEVSSSSSRYEAPTR